MFFFIYMIKVNLNLSFSINSRLLVFKDLILEVFINYY